VTGEPEAMRQELPPDAGRAEGLVARRLARRRAAARFDCFVCDVAAQKPAPNSAGVQHSCCSEAGPGKTAA